MSTISHLSPDFCYSKCDSNGQNAYGLGARSKFLIFIYDF